MRHELRVAEQKAEADRQFTHESHAAYLKCRELELMDRREALRPHQVYRASVSYDVTEQAYCCYLMMGDDYDADEDDEGFLTHHRAPIVAHGATPAEACDNFDHEWVHGRKTDGE